MRFIKHLTTWLLLLTVLTASGIVSAKIASGSQNLSGGLHQENITANALMHLAKIGISYDAASGFPLATKSAFSKVAPATARQLQKKFKHAGDFGVTGNYNPANAQKFNQSIQRHLNAPGTKEISGTYRGNPATFHTNPNSGLTVIQNSNGSFLSGWKLNRQQLQHVLKDGKL